ncbi:MAG: hypothetical protein AAF702_04075 [Chloroflexota bacterium]
MSSPFLTALITVAIFAIYRFVILLFIKGATPVLPDTDEWFHLVRIRAIRENHYRPATFVAGYDNPIYYPWFAHWLLAFVPENLLRIASIYLGSLIELANFTVFQLFALFIVQTVSQPLAVESLLWSNLLIFLSSPILTRNASGRFLIRPRPFGISFFILVFIFLCTYSVTGNLVWYAAAVGMAGLIYVTSKFAIQALLGYSIIVGLATGSYLLALFPIVSLVASIVLTGGWSLRVIWGQISHLHLYWTDIYDSYSYVTTKNSWKSIRDAISSFSVKASYKLYDTNSYLILLIGMPFLLLYYQLAYYADALLPTSISNYLQSWLWAGPLLMILTSIGKMKIFGQAERYLDFCFFPYAFMASLYLTVVGFTPLSVLFIIIGFGFTFVNFWVQKYRRDKNREPLTMIEEAFRWLAQVPTKQTILTIPISWAHYGVYFTKHTYISLIGLATRGNKQARFRELIGRYPLPVADLESLAERKQIHTIVLSRNNESDFDVSNFTEIYANTSVLVYRTHIADVEAD